MSEAPVRIVGSFLSPYVRKVLACLVLKGLPFEVDPIVPFFGNDAFGAISPLRRIPVLMHEGVTLCDSSVICEYLEERWPSPPLLPADVRDRARARWLEEYSDSRMGDVFIWRLFNPLAIQGAVWGSTPDRDLAARTIAEEIPGVLDYLEAELPAEGFLFGALGLADIALAAPFRNAGFVRFSVDPARWPRTAAFVARVLESPPLAALRPYEEACLRTPIAGHRQALTAAGAPLTAESYFDPNPRRGVMGV